MATGTGTTAAAAATAATGTTGAATTAASALGGQADASLVRVLVGNFPGCVLVWSKLNSEGPVFASVMLSLFVVHTSERA